MARYGMPKFQVPVLAALGMLSISSQNIPAAEQEAAAVMQFVNMVPGTFLMGSPASDSEARDFEKPQHEVTLTRAFAISRHEVTQGQWQAVMGEGPFGRDRSNPFYGLPGMAERITHSDHPATVSWNDAQAFVARLNAREPDAHYRLPTEAEWEFAARAGTTTRYSFGEDDRQLARYAWYGENFSTGGSHPVGTKQPNSWGLYDMHGNVWEWVADWFDPAYYAVSPPVDPKGPAQGTKRVVRGGRWHTTADSWRTAFRRDYVPIIAVSASVSGSSGRPAYKRGQDIGTR